MSIRELVRRYLEREDLAVVTTGSGAEALSILERIGIDLLVLDLNLPDVADETIAREFADRLPIVMLTAKSMVAISDLTIEGWSVERIYPDLHHKVAVLACRIAWNHHPLPDGNKRAAWACLVLFIDLNNGSWNDEQPDTDDAVDAMLAVAAREVDETWFAAWLRERITFRA